MKKTRHVRYAFVEGELIENVTFEFDRTITAITPSSTPPDGEHHENVLAVPGLVNAHSHAFQRAIRGRTEFRPHNDPSADFWSWRNEMYRVALKCTADQLASIARFTFMEMALSGITSVGEFHYVHHQPDGEPYPDPMHLAKTMISSARWVGLKIRLLSVAYQRGGFNKPVDAAQRRFIFEDTERYLSATDKLTSHGDFGYAPHSIRAVPKPALVTIAKHAQRNHRPLHIHVCEQQREIEESLAEYDQTPIEVLAEVGALTPTTTLVHATHLSDRDHQLIAESGAIVCACPTTERNLGDGFLPGRRLFEDAVPICLGSDSHANIDLWEEARLVEYHERLREQRRTIIGHPGGDEITNGPALLDMMTRNGAKSLGLNTGSLAVGEDADFVTVDLRHPSMLGSDARSVLNNAVLSMTIGAIQDVVAEGSTIIASGRHPHQDAISDRFINTCEELLNEN